MMEESSLQLSCQTILGPQCSENGITRNSETLEASGPQQNEMDGISIKKEIVDEGDSDLDGNSGSSSGSRLNKEDRGVLGGNNVSCEYKMTESTGSVCSHCKKIDGTSIKEERIDEGDSVPDGNSGSCECEMTESTGTVCSLCKKKLELRDKNVKTPFSEEHQLMKHLQNHVGILISDTFQCSYCKESFQSNSDLVKHERMCTEKNSDECIKSTISFATMDGDRIHSERTGDVEPQFPCFNCHEIFSSMQHLDRHVDGEKLQDDKVEFAQKPFHCSKCDRRFPSECGLANHKRKHENRSYDCSHCSKSFTSTNERQMHEKEHGDKDPLECQYCGKKCSKRFFLKEHIRTHTNERPYQCQYCGKKFSRKDTLISHIRIHTNERPHQCIHCDKKFTRKGKLNAHLKIHANEKPYECTYCGKKFIHKCALNVHIRIHAKRSLMNAHSVARNSMQKLI
nr:zinc finger protein 664-like [Lytechinus pictus]XP_054773195.1 zinc finger protein 664-like [Lytechinus pictus]